jgi:G3E family GTPase
LIKKLNHRAKIIECSRGKVDVKSLVNTGSFKLDVAQSGYGWLQDLHAMTVREVSFVSHVPLVANLLFTILSQVNGRNVLTPKPETEEYNVQSFIYTRYRPFHPRRLFGLLYDKFILQMEHPEDDDEESIDEDEDMDQDDEPLGDQDVEMEVEVIGKDNSNSPESSSGSDRRGSISERSENSSASTARTLPSPMSKFRKLASGDDDTMDVDDMDIPSNTTILTNKRAHPTFQRLFRSKGEFFLATRPHRAGDWSQAGAMLTLTGGRAWFCTLPPEEYTTGDEEVDALVRHDIKKGGEWGDRRQELVFIGERLDHAALEKLLDHCLLSDSEMKQWEKIMRDDGLDVSSRVDALQDLFEDGFPDWVEEEDAEDDEGMDADAHHGHNHGRGLKHNVAAKTGKVLVEEQ